MRTRTHLEPRVPLAAFAVALTAIAVTALTGTIGLRAGDGDTSIPADVRSLATEITPALPAGKISADEAIVAFERAMGQWDGAEITSYLVRMTASEIPSITDRDVWVLKYDGVQVPFSVPYAPHGVDRAWPHGTPTAGEVLYAFVDAKTGEWLAATNSAN